MDNIKQIIYDIDHHMGISLITLAFIYLLYQTLKNKKSLLPRYFFLLYGIGGLMIMSEMITQTKPTVVIMELLGAFIALYLFFYSYYH